MIEEKDDNMNTNLKAQVKSRNDKTMQAASQDRERHVQIVNPIISLQSKIGNQAIQRLFRDRTWGEIGNQTAPAREASMAVRDLKGDIYHRIQEARLREKNQKDIGIHIHRDEQADRLTRELDAHGFTLGQDIFLRADSTQNPNLLAHEMAHAQKNDNAYLDFWRTGQATDRNTYVRAVRRVLAGTPTSWNHTNGPRGRIRGRMVGVLQELKQKVRHTLDPSRTAYQRSADLAELRHFCADYGSVQDFIVDLANCVRRMAMANSHPLSSSHRYPSHGMQSWADRTYAVTWFEGFSRYMNSALPGLIPGSLETRGTSIIFPLNERQWNPAEQRTNQQIEQSANQQAWLRIWRSYYSSPTNNSERLAKWLLERWNSGGQHWPDADLRIAEWLPNRQLTNQNYRNSFGVINTSLRRSLGLASQSEAERAGEEYFRSIYDQYYNRLHILGVDLCKYNYRNCQHGNQASVSGNFASRMDAWGHLNQNLGGLRESLPHRGQIYQMCQTYKNRPAPPSIVHRAIVLASGISCDTNGCQFLPPPR